jgi:uncharacterized protein YyaL (SSP411 family)
MIGAFARVARVLRSFESDGRQRSQRYLGAAQRAARFIRARMWNETTRMLLRRFRDGDAQIDGYAEDYAFLISGLLELFQADPDAEWLRWAIALQRRQDELFWDEAEGGWFSTTGRDPNVLVRLKEDYDGAEPTASSVSVMNLLLLSHLAEDPHWAARIERTLAFFGPRLEQIGRAVPMMAAALSTSAAGLQQVVIVGADSGRDAGDSGRSGETAGARRDGEALEHAVAVRYRPFTITLALTADRQAALAPLAPFIGAMLPVNGTAAAYVCRHFMCRQPVTAPDALERELSS